MSPKSQPFYFAEQPAEYRVVTVRELPAYGLCDRPEDAWLFWRKHVRHATWFSPDQECFVVILLDARRNTTGFHLVGLGTLDTVTVHPREVFRPAIAGCAWGIIVMHNHPSGDPSPSSADVRITRDLIRAGHLLKIDLLDHVIVGTATADRSRPYLSLREQGHFYA